MIEKYIEFYAADFLISTAELTNEEVGILITKICFAVENEDIDYLSQFKFLGKIHTRIAGHRKAMPKYLRKEVLSRDNYMCQYCGCQMFLEIDHVVPYSVVGEHSKENLQVLCKPCNMRKGTTHE